MVGDVVVFAVIVTIFAIAGIRVGMLVAGRLDRMTEPDDEEADDGND